MCALNHPAVLILLQGKAGKGTHGDKTICFMGKGAQIIERAGYET